MEAEVMMMMLMMMLVVILKEVSGQLLFRAP